MCAMHQTLTLRQPSRADQASTSALSAADTFTAVMKQDSRVLATNKALSGQVSYSLSSIKCVCGGQSRVVHSWTTIRIILAYCHHPYGGLRGGAEGYQRDTTAPTSSTDGLLHASEVTAYNSIPQCFVSRFFYGLVERCDGHRFKTV